MHRDPAFAMQCEDEEREDADSDLRIHL